MKLKVKILYLFILSLLVIPGALSALETAPDITDREVVEKLARLEAGQAALNQKIESGQESLNQKIESGQESLNHRISDLRSEMKAGQEALGQRLDDLAKRIDNTNNTMLVLFGSLITLIVALFGYIAWDRRTMMKPVLERIECLEKDVARSLELSDTDGSKLSRLLLDAMRELAKTNGQLATILRSFSLL
ncbi:hypothetical protein SAMN02746065_1427 [Desulfocicer vacuolatum DSM 3385]|uniref:Uncharacterized protein n=1 Tax=Desulfocicer vacuolatum DSM 3385 TaxID=1121400 RepID=A0A1W2ESE3_9BACT|nr:hypothetical protein [Desulfocicer vacuolatum]SMD12627.1 hypothetical protein SAMN02746065_1427 [Desulfocicer vacuolatum DSM 3385]